MYLPNNIIIYECRYSVKFNADEISQIENPCKVSLFKLISYKHRRRNLKISHRFVELLSSPKLYCNIQGNKKTKSSEFHSATFYSLIVSLTFQYLYLTIFGMCQKIKFPRSIDTWCTFSAFLPSVQSEYLLYTLNHCTVHTGRYCRLTQIQRMCDEWLGQKTYKKNSV